MVLYKLYTPEFNRVNKSQYGRGSDFKQDIVEHAGYSCYIPTSSNCFVNCPNHLTDKDYMKEVLIFIRTEQRRSNVITSAGFQPFFWKT